MQVNQSAQLYRLQTLDLSIGKLRARLKQIDDLLSKDEDTMRATTRRDSANETYKPLHTRAADLELEIKSLAEKITEVDGELYSGNNTNAKVLQELQAELDALKRQETTLQESLMEVMLQVESAQATIADAETTLAQARDTRVERQAEWLEEKAKLQADLTVAENKRRDQVAKIDPAALKIYDTLRPRMKGTPVAVLGPDGCMSCHVEQTSIINQQVRMGAKIVYCESCGRILASA